MLLAGLPVRRLWGIGPVAEERLHRLGIDTVGALAALTDSEVADVLGATVGPALHRLAKGIDDRPVAERAGRKQISAESTFAADLTTLDQLRDAVGPIGEHAHSRLERDGRGARTVIVKLKKSDMSTLTRSATLPYATTEVVDADRDRPAAAARSGRDRADSACRRWLFGAVRSHAGVAVSRSRSDPGGLGQSATSGPAAPPRASGASGGASATTSSTPQYGHGWVQGAGHGVMTVRFETRGSGPGVVRTFADDSPDVAGPIRSTAWTGRTTSCERRA